MSVATLWSGPYAAAALLLAVAGAAKVRRPEATATVLRQAGLRAGGAAVRTVAALEVAIALWALTPSRTAAAFLSASYLVFAGFVALALRRGSPVSSCGCFASADVPPTAGHLALNLAAAAVAAWAVLHPHAGMVTLLRHQPLGGIPFVLLAAAVAYLAYLVMTVLPRTNALSRGSP